MAISAALTETVVRCDFIFHPCRLESSGGSPDMYGKFIWQVFCLHGLATTMSNIFHQAVAHFYATLTHCGQRTSAVQCRTARQPQEDAMLYRGLIGLGGVAALAMPMGNVQASDNTKYPDWTGQWGRFAVRGLPGQPSFDQTKGWGPFQQAPLTPEYQKVLEESMADQENGGLGNYSTARCLPGGMPRMMVAFEPQEYIITPNTTYILIGENDHYRRIFTDGRDWPTDIEPTYQGYSIGRWIDEAAGRYNVLGAETRGPSEDPRANA